jgi:hypothetical protein
VIEVYFKRVSQLLFERNEKSRNIVRTTGVLADT